MTDSPAVRFPLDPQEQPILDGLYEVRAKLEFLKQDRSNYIKSQDVLAYYNQVLEQVGALNRIRTTKRHEQNRGEAASTRVMSMRQEANMAYYDSRYCAR